MSTKNSMSQGFRAIAEISIYADVFAATYAAWPHYNPGAVYVEPTSRRLAQMLQLHLACNK